MTSYIQLEIMKQNANNEKTLTVRMPYAAPALEVYEYKVEQGYAVTNVEMYNREEISEIQDGGGDAFHGEWF